MVTTFFVLMALTAIAAAAVGALMVARSVPADRAVVRRLARAAPLRDTVEAETSEEGVLARWLDKQAPWLRRKLLAAGARYTPLQLVATSAGLTTAFLIATLLIRMPFELALIASLAVGLAGPTLVVSVLAARRRKAFLSQMPGAVDLIARALQAGHPVTSAMSMVAQQMPDPIGPEFAVVLAELNYGLDRDVALRHLVARFPIPELRMFVASLEVTRETGGNLAEVLMQIAHTIRAKAQLREKVRALSAEGRLTFWAVSALPVVVGGAILFLRPGYYLEVIHDPLFEPMMIGAGVMLAIGAFATWRLVDVKL